MDSSASFKTCKSAKKHELHILSCHSLADGGNAIYAIIHTGMICSMRHSYILVGR